MPYPFPQPTPLSTPPPLLCQPTLTPQVFAEVIASISAFLAILYMIPPIARLHLFFALDLVIAIIWFVLFGIFGSMYIPEVYDGYDYGIVRMKNAVWVDLTNALLWLGSAVWMFCLWKDWGARTGGVGRMGSKSGGGMGRAGLGRRGWLGGKRSGLTGRARADRGNVMVAQP